MSIFDDHSGKFVSAGITTVLGGFAWLVRTVLTNQKVLAVQQEKLRNLHSDVTEIKEANAAAVARQDEIVNLLKEALK